MSSIIFWIILIVAFSIYVDDITDIIYYLKVPFNNKSLKNAYFWLLIIRPAIIFIVFFITLCIPDDK